MLHYFIDAPSWDEYFPSAETENPFPFTRNPENRPLSLPRGGPWQYVDTDWGPINLTDEEYGGDYAVAGWVADQLGRQHDKPFFLACGIYRPHEPWFVPAKYFEPFPLESIQLPPGYRADDLDDLPAEGQRRGPNRYFAHIQKHNQWKQAIQAYLASIHYADAMVATVLDALENGPNAENTIVVLWSDHGWHLGEKQHWQKYTGWRVCTRVPLMIRVPRGATGLPGGTSPAVCDRPVNLVSLFPTLLDLCGLAPETVHDGPSLVPLLEDSDADWSHVSLTYLHDPGSFALSADRWRLIHYADGDEELYDVQRDPYEWNNLAQDAGSSATLDGLRKFFPESFAPKPRPSVVSLSNLTWFALDAAAAPASRPDGNTFDVVFINESEEVAKVFWMDRQGEPRFYAELTPGQQHRQQTRPGAVWFVTDEDEQGLGYFRVDDRTAKAVIPKRGR